MDGRKQLKIVKPETLTSPERMRLYAEGYAVELTAEERQQYEAQQARTTH